MRNSIQTSSLRNFISNTIQMPFDASHHQLTAYPKHIPQPHRCQMWSSHQQVESQVMRILPMIKNIWEELLTKTTIKMRKKKSFKGKVTKAKIVIFLFYKFRFFVIKESKKKCQKGWYKKASSTTVYKC